MHMHLYDDEEIADSLEACKTAKQYYGAVLEEKGPSSQDVLNDLFWKTDRSGQAMITVGQNMTAVSDDMLLHRREIREEKTGRFRLLHSLLVLAVCVLLAYAIASCVTHHVAHQTWVEGESMEPTLKNGDSVIVQKISYYLENPKRYDVIVFPIKNAGETGQKKDTYYVKRVIGLPGETVQIRNGKVYINDQKLKDDIYGKVAMMDAGKAENPVKLHKDEYFVLGDNRNMSTDSRSSYVGLVKKKDIIGKVFLCVWPFSRLGKI